MKLEKEYIEELLGRFVAGETSEAEEQILSDYFCTTEEIPDAWRMYKELFQSFKSDDYDFSEEEVDAMLAPQPEKRQKVVRLWPWTVAASAAVVIGLFTPILLSRDPVPAEELPLNNISTLELIETLELLTDIGPDAMTVTVSQQSQGFVVKTLSTDGQSNSFNLRRCADQSSIELTSQTINF